MNIQVKRPRDANYTPRDLMIQYAREHEPSVQFVPRLYRPWLVIEGCRYAYERWSIEPADENTDVITLRLAPILYIAPIQ